MSQNLIEFPLTISPSVAYDFFHGKNKGFTYDLVRRSKFTAPKMFSDTEDVLSEAFALFLERHLGKTVDIKELSSALIGAYANAQEKEFRWDDRVIRDGYELDRRMMTEDGNMEEEASSTYAEFVLESQSEDNPSDMVTHQSAIESLLKSLKPILNPISDDDLYEMAYRLTVFALSKSPEERTRKKLEVSKVSFGDSKDPQANRMRARIDFLRNQNSPRHWKFREAIAEAFRGNSIENMELL